MEGKGTYKWRGRGLISGGEGVYKWRGRGLISRGEGGL